LIKTFELQNIADPSAAEGSKSTANDSMAYFVFETRKPDNRQQSDDKIAVTRQPEVIGPGEGGRERGDWANWVAEIFSCGRADNLLNIVYQSPENRLTAPQKKGSTKEINTGQGVGT
jgi:hypothetical protein